MCYRDPIVPNRARKMGQLFVRNLMEWGIISPWRGHVYKGIDCKPWIVFPGLTLSGEASYTKSMTILRLRRITIYNLIYRFSEKLKKRKDIGF